MIIKNTEKTANKATIVVEIEKELMNKGAEIAYKKQRKNIRIPGFRPGKAPRKMIEKMYGEFVFFEDGLEEIFPEIYDFAIGGNTEFKPVGRPSLENMDIAEDGTTAELLWGYKDGGKFTSELPAHLMSHIKRLEVNPNNRVIMHTHPTNLLAMTFVHTLDEREFTRTLWRMCTECIVVFPDGVNVLPWMVCGNNAIGEATAEKMATARLVVWALHGIYGAGDCIGDKETEILLNSIFTPIFESFDLDLVITGHTHSQGRSHFMKKRKIVGRAENGKTYKDPEGIVYINANSVCGKVVMDYEADYLAYAFMENDVTTYTTLEYKDNQLILETRRGDSGALLDSITLERTRLHNENSTANKLRRITYKPIEFAGWAYNKIVKLLTK